MTEDAYLEAASEASDSLMALIWCDAASIVQSGGSFTLATHVRYLAALCAGELVTITTQLLSGKGKTLRLSHRLNGPSRDIAATIETVLIHIDLETRRSAPPAECFSGLIAETAMRYVGLPYPEAAGQGIATRARTRSSS